MAALKALTTKVEKKQAAEQKLKQQIESHEIDTQLAVAQAEEEAEAEAGTSVLPPSISSPPILSSALVSSWPLSSHYADHPYTDMHENDRARGDSDTQQLQVPRAIVTHAIPQSCKGASDSEAINKQSSQHASYTCQATIIACQVRSSTS